MFIPLPKRVYVDGSKLSHTARKGRFEAFPFTRDSHFGYIFFGSPPHTKWVGTQAMHKLGFRAWDPHPVKGLALSFAQTGGPPFAWYLRGNQKETQFVRIVWSGCYF